MLMRYLAFMGGRSCTEGRTVEQQVLEVNYIYISSAFIQLPKSHGKTESAVGFDHLIDEYLYSAV